MSKIKLHSLVGTLSISLWTCFNIATACVRNFMSFKVLFYVERISCRNSLESANSCFDVFCWPKPTIMVNT